MQCPIVKRNIDTYQVYRPYQKISREPDARDVPDVPTSRDMITVLPVGFLPVRGFAGLLDMQVFSLNQKGPITRASGLVK